MSLTINGLSVASMTWRAGWSGVWVAELDLLGGDLTPSGKVAIVSTEGDALVGTVDSDHSGAFGEKRSVRVLGGGGGWGKDVRAQHYHSDIGLTLAVVATTTAAEALEVATVLEPKLLGPDFVRRAGPASQIFTDLGVDWYVGLDGVTRVGPRLPAIPSTELKILDWNPTLNVVSFSSPTLPQPGTVLVDERFGLGTKTVTSVEAHMSGGSVTGTLWVADSAADSGTISELVEGLAALAVESTQAPYGRLYEYRVIAMAGTRVECQAVNRSAGMPDILPASVWAGASGYRATLTPGSRVLIGFIEGDRTKPFVAFYEPPDAGAWRPVTLDLDATALVNVGALAAGVVLGTAGPTAYPVVRLHPTFATWIAAVTAAVNALAPGSCVPPIGLASTKVLSS